MMRCARATALLLAAWLVAACAPAAFVPYRPGEPPTVTLPVALAGVIDARAGFAVLYAAELRTPGRIDAGTWLHMPPDAASPGLPASLPAVFAERAASTSVLVVGGLFGDCLGAQAVPFGDGVDRPPERSAVDSYAQYADLGLRSIRLVPLPGRASSDANGRLLAEAIRAEAAVPGVQRIVLVGYSKGVPDALHALALLQHESGLPRSVVALVSIAGAVMGTPLADGYLRQLREAFGHPAHPILLFDLCRGIELVYAMERAMELRPVASTPRTDVPSLRSGPRNAPPP